MNDEYDFSQAQRGRFFRQDATLAQPIYLDADVLASLKARAETQGMSLEDLVNALLRSDLERAERVTPS